MLWLRRLLGLSVEREGDGRTHTGFFTAVAPEYHLASKASNELHEAEPPCHHVANSPDLLPQASLSPKHGHMPEAVAFRHVSPTL